MKPHIAIGSVLIACASACERKDPGAESAAEEANSDTEISEGAALRTGVTSWAEAIAQARCDREQRCGNIGAERDFAEREVCLSVNRSQWRRELNAFDCPGGVNEQALHVCLDEVRNENCGQPFDTLERIVACRSGDLCEATAP